MGKAIITIEDGQGGMGIVIGCEFDPPLQQGVKPSFAQACAAELMKSFAEADGAEVTVDGKKAD